MTDLISRADAIEAVHYAKNKDDTLHRIQALPSAEAKPTMTEEVREALMRLTMCAREECAICKYKDKCNFDFQYEESTKNMNTILDSLMRSKCEVNAKWILCSERLPKEYAQYLVCLESGECYVYWLEDSDWARSMTKKEGILAWMPLPMPYREDGEA